MSFTKVFSLTIVVLTLSDTIFAKIHRHHASSEFHFDWGWNSVAWGERQLASRWSERNFWGVKINWKLSTKRILSCGSCVLFKLDLIKWNLAVTCCEQRLLHHRLSASYTFTSREDKWNIFTFFISQATTFVQQHSNSSPHTQPMNEHRFNKLLLYSTTHKRETILDKSLKKKLEKFTQKKAIKSFINYLNLFEARANWRFFYSWTERDTAAAPARASFYLLLTSNKSSLIILVLKTLPSGKLFFISKRVNRLQYLLDSFTRAKISEV